MKIRSLAICVAVMVAGSFAMPGAGDARPPVHCPPGLAKKAVPCVPPGLAQRGGWSIGEPLPRGTRYVVIDDYWRYGLARPSRGTQYVRVDNDVLRIVVETARVVESLQTIGRLLN